MEFDEASIKYFNENCTTFNTLDNFLDDLRREKQKANECLTQFLSQSTITALNDPNFHSIEKNFKNVIINMDSNQEIKQFRHIENQYKNIIKKYTFLFNADIIFQMQEQNQINADIGWLKEQFENVIKQKQFINYHDTYQNFSRRFSNSMKTLYNLKFLPSYLEFYSDIHNGLQVFFSIHPDSVRDYIHAAFWRCRKAV